MADKKIPELPELSGPPASNDQIEIVDVSDTTDDSTGTSKFIQASNFIGADGVDGADGADGNVWFVGNIAFPPSALNTGDLLLNTTGEVYQAAAPGTGNWGSPLLNITGPTGAAGVQNINAITAAIGTNSIDNTSYNQAWNWSTVSGDALTLQVHGTNAFQLGWDGSQINVLMPSGLFYFSGATLKLFSGTGSGQFSAIPDPTGGVVVDDECRAALAALLAAFRTRGDLGT